MKKVNTVLGAVALYGLIVFIAPEACAGRNQIIDRALDCVAEQRMAGEISFQDVCAVTDAPRPAAVTTDPVYVTPPSYDLSIAERESFYERYLSPQNPANTYEVGVEIFDYTYREEGFMKLDGSMTGLYGAYTHRFRENPPIASMKEIFSGIDRLNFIRLDSRYSRGTDIKYRSEGTGQIENETHFTYETRLVFGADYPLADRPITVSPYGGIGYRYLMDDNGGRQSTTGAWSYDRESQYVYIPLGVDIIRAFENGWDIGVNLEYDLFIDGEQESHFETFDARYSSVVKDQNEGYGVRGSIKFIKRMEKVNLSIEPFTRYWHIEQSELGARTFNGVVDSYWIEPNNRTWEFGVKAGVQF